MKHTHGLDVPQNLEELCDPRTMALLVYDMQVGIRSQIKGGDEIVARVGRALAAARGAGMRVVYTRHLSLAKSWMGVTQYRTAMAWQRKEEPDAVTPWFLRDAPAAAIVPELAPTSDDAVFDKLAMSAFEGTPLRYALRDCGILSLAIVGIALEIGIRADRATCQRRGNHSGGARRCMRRGQSGGWRARAREHAIHWGNRRE